MNFERLEQFIQDQDRRLTDNSLADSGFRPAQILARTVKLNEEVGELCNEVLAFLGQQRKDKLEHYDKNKLADEVADVILTTLLIAKATEIDFEKALEEKIAKIEKRYARK